VEDILVVIPHLSNKLTFLAQLGFIPNLKLIPIVPLFLLLHTMETHKLRLTYLPMVTIPLLVAVVVVRIVFPLEEEVGVRNTMNLDLKGNSKKCFG